MDTMPLVQTLVAVTREYWNVNQRPLLLSHAPAIFAMKQVDYRTEIAGCSLKSFVERTAGDATYKVVMHTKHRAKIGLVPPEVDYEFEVDKDSTQDVVSSEFLTLENDAVALLTILSRLDKEDLDKINIPVSVLVKLFQKP